MSEANSKAFYFWRPQYANGEFSNWSNHPIVEDGVAYPTVEHYIMYHKAKLMGDDATAAMILTTRHPMLAKKLGREVKDYNEDLWVAKRCDVLLKALALKASQHPTILKRLRETGDRLIAEASPWDAIWGIGCDASQARCVDVGRWGMNLLGKGWMDLRTIDRTTGLAKYLET